MQNGIDDVESADDNAAFVSAMKKMPSTDEPIHRAFQASPAQVAALTKPGTEVSVRQTQSWTKSSDMAKAWISDESSPGGRPTILSITSSSKNKDISSKNHLQQEVLMPKATKLKVVTSFDAGDYLSVTLAEMD